MEIRGGRLTSALLLVFVTLLGSNLAHADVTGSILGVVRDRSQAVLTGAHVVVTNAQTNYSQETTSAADGSYRILALPVGNYKLTATAPGFGPFTATDIVLKVNDQLHFDITLQVGSVQQEVSVSADAVQVESESTQLGAEWPQLHRPSRPSGRSCARHVRVNAAGPAGFGYVVAW